MTAATGFTALYRRRLSVSLSQPTALAGQVVTPVLWVLVVGPALTRAFGGFTHQVDYTSYVSLGQVVFILPFSAMFAGLTTIFDRDWGIMRELLVAPIRRAVIPLASTAVVLTIAAGQFAIIIGLALARGAHFATTPARLLAALAAAALLSAGVYGLAEFLVYTIKKPQAFGTLIPAIGATPYVLCGAIYPIAVLPSSIKWLTWTLPWTHGVSLLRYGLMGDTAASLHQIWPDTLSPASAALLSLAVLAAFAALTQTAAHRAFTRSTLK
ncbi:MAG TPA: ABC transporter permease [Streptosporangiaceae bacterium]|nr:ABC transporter permease [Streptosporangiaceae bacterium]